jgi:hypothetical protein
MTTAEFVIANGITAEIEQAVANPNMDASADMDNYKVGLRIRRQLQYGMGQRYMTTYFSKGIGHHGAEPTATEVLDCLASDASSVEYSADFEEWATESGYDTDSRKAYRTWETINAQTKKLKAFLGEELYDALLNDTDRD